MLALVGILGFIGVLGPATEQSIFGGSWYFDNGENWTHLILGIVALIAAFALGAGMQKHLVLLVGLLALLVGVVGFFVSSTPPNFLGANLENPLDNLLHIVVGIWAILAWKGAKEGMMMQSRM